MTIAFQGGPKVNQVFSRILTYREYVDAFVWLEARQNLMSDLDWADVVHQTSPFLQDAMYWMTKYNIVDPPMGRIGVPRTTGSRLIIPFKLTWG